MTTYEISIENKSGAQQNYMIFNEAPLINKSVDSNVWLNVFQQRPTAVNQVCVFKFNTVYGAVAGSANDTPGNGVSVSVGGPQSVSLGVASSDGSLKTPGTSLAFTVQGGAPQFKPNNPKANGSIQAFEIVTDGSFTYNEAVNNNYLIGLAGDTKGTGLDGPAATFVPQPNKSYQIQPVKKYYVATGSYARGELIKVAEINVDIVPIDFSTRQSVKAKVVHDDRGNLTLQAS